MVRRHQKSLGHKPCQITIACWDAPRSSNAETGGRVAAPRRGWAIVGGPGRIVVGGNHWRSTIPLGAFLAGRPGGSCTLTHAAIEEILGTSLPASARSHRAWWGNEADGEHVQCRSWLGAGWEVCDGCEPHRGVVRFRRRS